MSTPMPSPSMNGTIGWSGAGCPGTSFSPPSGTWIGLVVLAIRDRTVPQAHPHVPRCLPASHARRLTCRRGGDMTTIPRERPMPARRSIWFDARDVWVSLAIAAIWLTVTLVSLFGPDFHGNGNDGTSTVIPSGIIVAFFALFATTSVAKYGFGKRER